ncbi:hypothetical protein SAMN05216338_105541 [Bradyrhizobium sp. Rc2d]|nr:hypothetical protein SAMN05216338_105541 [Bradyrhizobium sp. Rc2d]
MFKGAAIAVLILVGSDQLLNRVQVIEVALFASIGIF